MAKKYEIASYLMVPKLGKTKKVIKVEKISGKDDILPVEDKRVALLGNNKKEALKLIHGKES